MVYCLRPTGRKRRQEILPSIFAGMMELVDMRDLGSRAFALGFESPCPHQKGTIVLIEQSSLYFVKNIYFKEKFELY